MNYISTKEASERWKISSSRVVALIKSGKIPGAVLMGNSWMIPSYAEKPGDGRRKDTPKDFRFPLLIYQDHREDDPLLGEEEKILLKGQKLCLKGETDKSVSILSLLLEKTKSQYIRLGAAYYMVINSILMGDPVKVDRYMMHFREENLRGPYEKELLFLRYDLMSYIIGNSGFLEHMDIDSSYSYHPDALPYITVLEAYRFLLEGITEKKTVQTAVLELYARTYDHEGKRLAALSIYLYLSLYFLLSGNVGKALDYARKGIRISVEDECYFLLASCYDSFPKHFEEFMKDLGEETKEKVRVLAKKFSSGLEKTMPQRRKNYLDKDLSGRGNLLINYAIKGMSNREIATKLGISEKTVKRGYNLLYEKTDTHSKEELAKFYVGYIYDYNFSTED